MAYYQSHTYIEIRVIPTNSIGKLGALPTNSIGEPKELPTNSIGEPGELDIDTDSIKEVVVMGVEFQEN
jgi:hypothetical protein